MIKVLQQTIDKARLDFKLYLEKKGRDDLLPNVDALFNIKAMNKSLNVLLMLNDETEVFNEAISVDDLDILPDLINEKTERIYRGKDDVLVTLVIDGNVVLDKSLKLKDFDDLKQLLVANKEQIFNEIGYIDIDFMHDKNELFSTKMRIDDILNLNELLLENQDIIYDNYLSVPLRKENFYGEGEGQISIPIAGVMTGNFIVSENDEYLADENGNFIVFE